MCSASHFGQIKQRPLPASWSTLNDFEFSEILLKVEAVSQICFKKIQNIHQHGALMMIYH